MSQYPLTVSSLWKETEEISIGKTALAAGGIAAGDWVLFWAAVILILTLSDATFMP